MHKVAEFSRAQQAAAGALRHPDRARGPADLIVPINYNMAAYVPKDAPLSVAINVMAEEFDDAIPNARVYVPALTLTEALETKQQIEAASGVLSVIWLVDFIDLKVPLELADQDVVAGFFTADGGALYQVAVDLTDTTTTLAQLQQIATPDGAVEGQLVDLALAQVSTTTEVNTIMLFMLPLGLLLLTLSTLSWIEPLILLATIGVAIARTWAATSSWVRFRSSPRRSRACCNSPCRWTTGFFLLHSRKRHLAAGADRRVAETGHRGELNGVLASSTTTIFGFLALMFMSFQLGPDMGLVLAKGVTFNLIMIFFMPALMLVLDRAVVATSHRSLLPNFARLGRGISRAAIWLLLIGLLLRLRTWRKA